MLLLIISGCTAILPYQRPSDKDVITEDIEGSAKNLVATATIRMEKTSGLDFTGRAVIIASKPDQFRIEFLGPFNQVVFVLACDGKNLSLLDERKGLLRRWPATESPYPFNGGEVAAYLMGSTPMIFGDKDSFKEIVVSRVEEGYVKSIVRYSSGNADLRVDMKEYRIISGIPIPFLISIKTEIGNITINYKTVKLNENITEVDFRLTVPPGGKEVYGDRE
jgi:outer membrane lipoprotein-sorting protein